MRSAIFYPQRQITDPVFLRNSLLLWDEMHVIDTNPERPLKEMPDDVRDAWTILGRSIQPTHQDKEHAHKLIEEMLERPEFLDNIPQDPGRRSAPDDLYELYPDKFLDCTWRMLREHARFRLLRNGDYGASEAIAIAIMSKLAEACGGDVFARVTNRVGGFALAADSGPAKVGERVVPVALALFDLSRIDLATVVEFRQREKNDISYRDLRHRYLDDVEQHILDLRAARNDLQVEELYRVFDERMKRHARDFKYGMKTNRLALVFQAVVSVVATAGGALANPAAAAANAVTSIRMIGDLFRLGLSYGTQQRALMSDNPMAYMYMLDRNARKH